MVAAVPICNFGWKAPDFRLPGTDGQVHSLDRVKGEKGTVVVFICNHCPYVKAVVHRLVSEAAALRSLGVATVAVCANDAAAYPTDSFDNMRRFAEQHQFGFPYLCDESQAVAKAYGAVCTPDFFGFNDKLELQYRGRLDASRATLVPNARRDLYEAMRGVAETGRGPRDQIASMGCSIKWKAA